MATPPWAMLAGAGVVTGVLAWGLIAALGLGAVLAVSELAYRCLQFAGAAYLIWLGIGMLRGAFRAREPGLPRVMAPSAPNWFLRGVMTNLLNPKVGVFYISFLPQFLPVGVPVVPFCSATIRMRFPVNQDETPRWVCGEGRA